MKPMSIPTALPGRRKNSGMFIFLLVISISYWYCLPVTTQSFIRYSEIRGYDLLLLVLSLVLINKYMPRLKAFLRRDKPGRNIIRFASWATATSIITVLMAVTYGRPYWALVTGVFLFHLWGFAFAYCALRIFITTRRQCFILLDTFLIIGALQAVIICLQGLGILPLFWSELYSAYGTDAFSGTLGPNRTLPGHTMLLVFALAAAYWRNAGAVGSRRLILATMGGLTSIAAIGLSGSRTSWMAFAAFCLAAVFAQRPQPGLLAFILVVMLGLTVALPDSIEDRVAQIYEGRMSSKLETAKDDTLLAKFQTVDAGRWKNWVAGVEELARRPWIAPFGGGFNNYRHLVAVDISAHNIYITLIVEVGLIGMFLYLGWLKSIWRESTRLIAVARRFKRRDKMVFLPVEMRALLIAMIVSLIAGEVLYPYRPAFAFMGMFLFLVAVMNNPLLVFGSEKSSSSAPRQNVRAIGQPLEGHEAA